MLKAAETYLGWRETVFWLNVFKCIQHREAWLTSRSREMTMSMREEKFSINSFLAWKPDWAEEPLFPVLLSSTDILTCLWNLSCSYVYDRWLIFIEESRDTVPVTFYYVSEKLKLYIFHLWREMKRERRRSETLKWRSLSEIPRRSLARRTIEAENTYERLWRNWRTCRRRKHLRRKKASAICILDREIRRENGWRQCSGCIA